MSKASNQSQYLSATISVTLEDAKLDRSWDVPSFSKPRF